MKDEHYNNSSTYEETMSQSTLKYNSIHHKTSIVRHNFKSIEELLSPIHTLSSKNNDTGYNSQLSISLQSQENDDNIENLTSKIVSTPLNKIKKIRTAFTDDQKQYLENFYSTNRYPDPTELETLSDLLILEEKVIRVWFQNKRSREKKSFI